MMHSSCRILTRCHPPFSITGMVTPQYSERKTITIRSKYDKYQSLPFNRKSFAPAMQITDTTLEDKKNFTTKLFHGPLQLYGLKMSNIKAGTHESLTFTQYTSIYLETYRILP